MVVRTPFWGVKAISARPATPMATAGTVVHRCGRSVRRRDRTPIKAQPSAKPIRRPPVMVDSVRPAKTTSVSARAVPRPVARDVATMRANGPCSAVPEVWSGWWSDGRSGWWTVMGVSTFMVVSLSQRGDPLPSSVAANASAHPGQMAGMWPGCRIGAARRGRAWRARRGRQCLPWRRRCAGGRRPCAVRPSTGRRRPCSRARRRRAGRP